MMTTWLRMCPSWAAVLLCFVVEAVGASPVYGLESPVKSEEAWPSNDGNGAGTRYSAATAINADNVGKLGLAWEFDDFIVRGRTHRAMEGNPIMVDGVLFLSGPWGNAYAVDARTGRKLWVYDTKADGQYARNACCDVGSRGIVVHAGKVYTASTDGYLIALDAHTGKLVWKSDTFYTRHWNYVINGAPVLAGNNILIGNAGADMGARGYVSAYDAQTGKFQWRFWAVPGDPKTAPDESPDVTFARKTWPTDARWDLGLGGNAWDGMAYDAATDTAFLGLGNGGPHPEWLRSKSGVNGLDNLFLSCIVAVDAKSGRMKWYYQETPGDSWDYTATAPMIFADLTIDGEAHKVLMQAPKNGIFYVLDRVTGKLLRADAYTTVNWTRGIDMHTGRPMLTGLADYSHGPRIVWPGAAGGHSWTPMSFSPRTGLVYVSVFDTAMLYSAVPQDHFIPGTINQAETGHFPPFDSPEEKAQLIGQPDPKFESRLKGWDPIAGKIRWESKALPFISGGTLVSGDVVFEGSSDGYLYAYDAASGKELSKLLLGTGITAAPITYQLDGIQYIAVTAGAGGPQGGFYAPDQAAHRYQNYERLIVLKIGGSEIPVPAPAKAVPVPPLPPKPATSVAVVLQGEALFKNFCERCHVLGGATGMYPNLWLMDENTLNAFDAIVGHGAYRFAGMADYSDVLNADAIAAVKAFIVTDTIVKRSQGTASGAHSRDATH